VPGDPKSNAIIVAAQAMLARLGDDRQPDIIIERSIPIAAGLGSSAAASVAGALAAAAASGRSYDNIDIAIAALEGESGVAGRHLDNIAPCIFGGVTIVRSVEPPEVHKIIPKIPLWLAVATPEVRLDTKVARGMLPPEVANPIWIQQMANATSLVYGLVQGDVNAIASALHDGFAEPVRKHTVPSFEQLRIAAMQAGALGFSISGAGPSVFALCASLIVAENAVDAMQAAAKGQISTVIGKIAAEGARCVQ
jgi:homoserine kinase